MNATHSLHRFALVGVLLCFVVVVLGAYVRLTAAGLGCPDWPGCYGHFTPSGAEQNPASQAASAGSPLDVGKAWREMAHRYAAATLGLLVLVMTALAVASRGPRPASLFYFVVLLALVVLQGMLGMLTVTWQLKPLIVTLHLIGGLATLAMLWWLWLGTRERPALRFASPHHGYRIRARGVRLAVTGALIVLGLQIALGGWTSSNYAAVACPDLPKCQNAWVPETDYADAFVLWRGLGMNYEGGVLDHPARVAIHFTHRIGAVFASLALLLAALAVLRHAELARARPAAIAVVAALGLQLAIGLLMVSEGFPLLLATAHNAGAALLLLAAVALQRRVSESRVA
jgi:cytochrome c oxidase assembly protein subunit 15